MMDLENLEVENLSEPDIYADFNADIRALGDYADVVTAANDIEVAEDGSLVGTLVVRFGDPEGIDPDEVSEMAKALKFAYEDDDAVCDCCGSCVEVEADAPVDDLAALRDNLKALVGELDGLMSKVESSTKH